MLNSEEKEVRKGSERQKTLSRTDLKVGVVAAGRRKIRYSCIKKAMDALSIAF